MKHSTQQTFWAYGMLAPALGLFALFIGLPMLLAFVIAFKRIDLAAGVASSPWVGGQNFLDLFSNALMAERIGRAFRNTLLFTVCFVPLNLLASLAIASMIHPLTERRQAFYRAAFYLPTVTSAVVFAMIWKWLYDPNFGLLNYALGWFGAGPIQWTGDPRWAMWAVILAALGAGPGGNVLIYLAALGSIPQDSMESARVDGANALQRWWFITLPLLKPVTLYLLVLNTIGSFQVFELVFILTSGGPAGSSTVIVYEIYDLAFGQGRYGVAGALSLILLAVVVVFALAQFRLLRSGASDTLGPAPGAMRDRFDRFWDAAGGLLGMFGAPRSPARRREPHKAAAAPPPPPRAPKVPSRAGAFARSLLRETPLHAILAPLALLFLIPMIWMFLSAFTPRIYLQATPPRISPAHFSLANYQLLLEKAPQIGRWFWNSAYLSLTVTIVQTLLSCLTGYVFARMLFPGRKLLFSAFLASIMLPWQAMIIPLFLVISTGLRDWFGVDLINTHWAVLLPGLCSPVGIFLMRQYIQDLPADLEEAARIDGCNEFRIWLHVILPLCRPVLGAWGILTFTGVWKRCFWPFVVLGSESLFTLEVGLQTLQQQNTTDYGLVMAGATASAIPMILIFFLFQKQIVKGLTFGAVKG